MTDFKNKSKDNTFFKNTFENKKKLLPLQSQNRGVAQPG